MQTLPRNKVADLPDRMIGATTLALHVPVISRDRQIRLREVAVEPAIRAPQRGE